jgi:hypothetical protein
MASKLFLCTVVSPISEIDAKMVTERGVSTIDCSCQMLPYIDNHFGMEFPCQRNRVNLLSPCQYLQILTMSLRISQGLFTPCLG